MIKDSGTEIYSYLMGKTGEQPVKKEAVEEKKEAAAGFYQRENGKVTLKRLMEMVWDGDQ